MNMGPPSKTIEKMKFTYTKPFTEKFYGINNK